MTIRPIRDHPTTRPREFVAEAERMTNQRDVHAARDVFAPSAVSTTTIDGMIITARGIDEIATNWRLMCRFMTARHLLVRKRLVTADDHTIVNEWEGGLGRTPAARGIEVWEFDESGLVSNQRLYGFLNPGSDGDALQSLRMALAYPVTAATFGYLRLTARAR